MARRPKTTFDVQLEAQMQTAEFAREFKHARAQIAAIDKATNEFLRALDRARVRRGLSKTELARRIGTNPR
jgi:hypothetical protein